MRFAQLILMSENRYHSAVLGRANSALAQIESLEKCVLGSKDAISDPEYRLLTYG
jgi:hypothetical protein